jgi:hypothetical protein
MTATAEINQMSSFVEKFIHRIYDYFIRNKFSVLKSWGNMIAYVSSILGDLEVKYLHSSPSNQYVLQRYHRYNILYVINMNILEIGLVSDELM